MDLRYANMFHIVIQLNLETVQNQAYIRSKRNLIQFIRKLPKHHDFPTVLGTCLFLMDKLTLSGHEELLLDLVPVGIPEVSDGEGGTTAGVMDDVLDDSLDVAVPLGEVDGTESRLALPVLGVGHEDGAGTLPLGADNTTHLCKRII